MLNKIRLGTIATFIAIISSLSISAQSSISGKVSDNAGKGIAGADGSLAAVSPNRGL